MSGLKDLSIARRIRPTPKTALGAMIVLRCSPELKAGLQRLCRRYRTDQSDLLRQLVAIAFAETFGEPLEVEGDER